MTIRRQWLLILTITALIAVCVNTLILSSLIDRYFLSYNTEAYNNHVEQIKQLAKSALMDNSLSQQQLKVQFESHLDDPIISIRLYDQTGQLIASAEEREGGRGQGMFKGMMRKNAQEVESYNISSGDSAVGELHIVRYNSLRNSMVSMMFRAALLRNSVESFVIVLIILVVIGLIVSRRVSRDLTSTAAQALNIDVGEHTNFIASKVKEISVIQSSLETLQSRLKIKQIGRKRIVDELVHQTRTPLTILKTHLEGLEDGVITMSGDEIKVFQAQLDNMASIISNMSMLLDADRPIESVRVEQVDIHVLLSQITSGLKAQFDKKKINLQLQSGQNGTVSTDRYKLSQSVYNLLTNAYKFTQPLGSVSIAYEVSREHVLIRIKDTGTGISKEDLLYVFEAYYRGHRAQAADGDGLGLFVVKENVQQLGGKISVQSEPGVGSEFVIELPVQQ